MTGRAQGGEQAGEGVAGAADGLHGRGRGGIDAVHHPAALDHAVNAALDQQVSGGVVVPVGAVDQVFRPVVLVEDEAAGVEGMRGLFVGQEGQFAQVRGEAVVAAGLAAHLGRIHEPGVGDEHRRPGHLFDGEQHPAVPVHIRLQVVENEHRAGAVRQVAAQPVVQAAAAVAAAGVADEIGVDLRPAQVGCHLQRRGEQGRGAALHVHLVAGHAYPPAVQAGRPVEKPQVRIRDRADYAEHCRSISSKASARA